MNNFDYWQTFVGEQSPEEFMRAFGAMDPELSVSRFLEERGHLYGVVNQGSWVDTFQAPEQHHVHTVRMYMLSYLDETREVWEPALEAKPPSIPRRYREKFDQDKYPPPPAAEDGSEETPSGVEDATGPESETAADGSPAQDAAQETHADNATSAVSPENVENPSQSEHAHSPDEAGEDDGNSGHDDDERG